MVDAFVAVITKRDGRTLESTIRARNYMVQMNSTAGYYHRRDRIDWSIDWLN